MKKKLVTRSIAAMLCGALLIGCGSASDSSSSTSSENETEDEVQEETQEEETETEIETETETESEEASYVVNWDEDPYVVEMYLLLPSEVPSGVDKIVSAINEITLADLNMELNLSFLTYADIYTQVPLMLSSQEKIDILFTASMLGSGYVNSGYLTDLTDLLPAVEDSLKATYGGAEVSFVSVGDTIFGIPMHKDQVYETTIFFATDVLEEHDLMDEALAITSLAELDAFFEVVSELEPDMWMFAPSEVGGGYLKNAVFDGLGDFYGVLTDIENSTTIENMFETDEFYEYCSYVHKWYENGWINKSASTDTESYYTYIKNGLAFSFLSDYGHPLSETDQEANCGGKDLTMVTIGEKYQTTETTFTWVYCIPTGSKDPEKAIQMINYMANSAEINNLLNWGIEGEDYIVTEDGHAAYPEGVTAETVEYHLDAGWTLPNQFLCYPWEGTDADIYDQMVEYNKTDVTQSIGLGLLYDSSSVSNELSAVQNVYSKYFNELITGALDPEEYIPIFNEELYASGLQTIMDEKQSQLDAFLASK